MYYDTHSIMHTLAHSKQLSTKKARATQLKSEIATVTGKNSVPFEEAKAQVERDIEKKLE